MSIYEHDEWPTLDLTRNIRGGAILKDTAGRVVAVINADGTHEIMPFAGKNPVASWEPFGVYSTAEARRMEEEVTKLIQKLSDRPLPEPTVTFNDVEQLIEDYHYGDSQ